MTPSFSDFLERDSTEKLREELEDAYYLLDQHNGLRALDLEEFVHEYLEEEYDSELSDYCDNQYQQYRDSRDD